jgi:hypothetical protein
VANRRYGSRKVKKRAKRKARAAAYALANEVFSRDGFRCYLCGQQVARGRKKSRRGKPLATIDHIVPLSRGGTSKITNLKTACESCNTRKNNKIFKQCRLALDTNVFWEQIKAELPWKKIGYWANPLATSYVCECCGDSRTSSVITLTAVSQWIVCRPCFRLLAKNRLVQQCSSGQQ